MSWDTLYIKAPRAIVKERYSVYKSYSVHNKCLKWKDDSEVFLLYSLSKSTSSTVCLEYTEYSLSRVHRVQFV